MFEAEIFDVGLLNDPIDVCFGHHDGHETRKEAQARANLVAERVAIESYRQMIGSVFIHM